MSSRDRRRLLGATRRGTRERRRSRGAAPLLAAGVEIFGEAAVEQTKGHLSGFLTVRSEGAWVTKAANHGAGRMGKAAPKSREPGTGIIPHHRNP